MQDHAKLFKWDPAIPIIISQNMLEDLSVGGARAIDQYLLPEIRLLREEYKRNGNPRLIYLAGSAIGMIVDSLQNRHISFQYSRLQALLAEMLVVQGSNITSLLKAIDHLETAIEVVNHVDALTDETIRAHVNYSLMLTIARKALGKFDDSLLYLRHTTKEFLLNSSVTELDLIPLRRQEIMMQQSKRLKFATFSLWPDFRIMEASHLGGAFHDNQRRIGPRMA